MSQISIFWHRRDLRFEDNTGLLNALQSGHPVLPLFIFDREILDKLSDPKDARVDFIHQQISDLAQRQTDRGSAFIVKYGHPLEVWQELIQEFQIAAVYTNRDYETYAKERDAAVSNLLAEHGIAFHDFKDHVIFENQEVQKKTGGTYTVFTPYKRTWLAQLTTEMIPVENANGEAELTSKYLQSIPSEEYLDNFLQIAAQPIPSLEDMGFQVTGMSFPSKEVPRKRVKNYDKTRNFPAIEGTTKLGIHFRFGTISIREKARRAQKLNDTYLSELIWRDFYAQILAAFPHVEQSCFRPPYEYIQWRNDETEFKLWCEGKTGFPIVDAGMRELNHTGYMHNRVRMIVASFLTKHLLIDWRWGEAYFAKKLLDFDLASNNGGWQWAAGCGTDAQPYFRVFNPTSQLDKFDKDRVYVKRWVPEYGTEDYPDPMVDHKMARERAITVYKESLEFAKSKV